MSHTHFLKEKYKLSKNHENFTYSFEKLWKVVLTVLTKKNSFKPFFTDLKLCFSHITRKESEDMLSAVQVLVQHLCTKCPERAEYRSIVAKVRQ